MRKIFTFIASVLVSVSTMAANFSVGGLYYSITSANTVQVVAPTTGKYTGAITIPEIVTYNATTYRVTAIGDDAFKGANQVTSVTLPLTGITSIGGWAFNDCTGLTSFTIPASVTSIGEKAFYYCDNLQHLYLHSKNPASYNPGNMAFSKIHYGSHVCTLHVPTGCTAAYAADATFSVFTQVAEFDPPQVYDLYINGTQVTSLNASDILGDGAASYDASAKTLTISGNITAPDNNTPCIESEINNLTINVAAAAMLSAYEKTIYLDGNATITGSALLTLSATKALVNEYDACSAIYAENNLHVSGAKLSIDGDFYCSGSLNITNSTLSTNYTIFGGGSEMAVTNSTVTITQGSILGYKSLTLTDCYLKTPQSGYYDTSKKQLVNAKGAGVSGVEIVATGVSTAEIKFVNYDGTVLQSGQVAYGETPAYSGATPTKPADAQYTYTFAGWTPEVVAVTGDATYTATYNETVNQYTITATAENGTVQGTGTYDYGTVVELTAVANDGYKFDKWSDDVTDNPRTVTVTENMAFTALFVLNGTTGIEDNHATEPAEKVLMDGILYIALPDGKIVNVLGQPVR